MSSKSPHLLETYWFVATFFALFVFHVNAADFRPTPVQYELTNGELEGIGQAVLRLLETKDTEVFATNLSESASDWHSLITTNMPAKEVEVLNRFAAGSNYNNLKSDANSTLTRANAWH